MAQLIVVIREIEWAFGALVHKASSRLAKKRLGVAHARHVAPVKYIGRI